MKIPSFVQGAAFCGLLFLGACHSKTAPGSASASPTPAGGFVAPEQARADRIKSELGLTDDQMQKIQAVMEEGRTARESMHSDQSMTREQRQAKYQEMRQDSETKIAAILTPDQLSKWEEFRKQNQGNHGHGHQGGDDAQQSPSPQQ